MKAVKAQIQDLQAKIEDAKRRLSEKMALSNVDDLTQLRQKVKLLIMSLAKEQEELRNGQRKRTGV